MTKEKAIRTTRLTIRFTKEEFKQLGQKKAGTTTRNLADFARRKLLDKTIVGTVRNRSLDELVIELTALRKILSPLAANFNQAVKKLHTLDAPNQAKGWLMAFNLDARILLNRVEEIKAKIDAISDQWLQ